MKGFGFGAALALFALWAGTAHADDCYDVTKGEPSTLSGRLQHIMFPGPPNYEDVQTGDMPEPTYILQLADPICLSDDGSGDSTDNFSRVHLVASDNPTGNAMKKLTNKNVVVELNKQMGSHTGHHHAPLVAWVTSIRKDGDITDEYGTGATTVRAFYYALQAGDGSMAAAFVVPEKTHSGNLSAHAMTAFYGNLPQPLELTELNPLDSNQVEVKYKFRSRQGPCDGNAVVDTVSRNGKFFIQSIRTLSKC